MMLRGLRDSALYKSTAHIDTDTDDVQWLLELSIKPRRHRGGTLECDNERAKMRKSENYYAAAITTGV